MLRNSRAHDFYRAWLVRPLTRLCRAAGVGSTSLSFAAVLAAAAGGAVLVLEPAWGGALFLLSGVLDTLDGAVSREARTATRAGAFLDSMLDRYAELLILIGVLGFYIRADRLTPLLAFSVLLAGFGSWMVSYAQSRAEGLGGDCSFGWLERPERVLFLSLGAVASRFIDVRATLPDFLETRPILGLSLIILAVGTNMTSLTRLRRGYRELRRDDEPTRLLECVSEYLAEQFPSHDVSREWDTSRRAVVFRIASRGKTMLVELPADILEEGGASAWVERMTRWDLPARLRKEPRIRVASSGLKPLPWRQLTPEPAGYATDEDVRETLPASDAVSPASISRS